MNTEIKDKIKIDLAYNNYYNIINKKLPYKFSYLDDWLLKKSKLLTKEADRLEKQIKNPIKHESPIYRTYKRGTIIKVDFGVGIGSEMSEIHFAIVLNKYDNPKNNVLTVLPLTSKENRFNLDLGNLIVDILLKKIRIEFKDIIIKLEKQIELTPNEKVKLNKFNTLLSYYRSSIKKTYACCNLVTTISKERIFLPINEYDIIGRVKCSNNVLNKIDYEMQKTLY